MESIRPTTRIDELFERTVDCRKFRVEFGAEPIHRRDDRKRYASRDQSIFDCGCAGFIGKKSPEYIRHYIASIR
jgi:hypothetical protein